LSEAKQVNVEFIGDYDLAFASDIFVVASDSTYVKACDELARGSVQKIWVRSRNHFQWLSAYCQRAGISAICSEKTPRILIADAWGVTLPEWTTDEMVMDEGLLQWSSPTDRQSSFIDLILSSVLGESMISSELGSNQVVGIVKSIAECENWKTAQDRPLVKNSLRDKSEGWKHRAKATWETRFAAALLEDPEGLWRDLSILAILRKYPEKLTEYLVAKDRIASLSGFPADALAKIPLHTGAVELATGQIEIFFSDVVSSMKKPDELSSLIGCLSGRLPREFHLLDQTLGRITFDVPGDAIGTVRRVFSECQGVSRSRLDALKRFIRPAKPEFSASTSSWNASAWMKWSIEEYFSYRQWQSATGTVDSDVEAMVQRFSDWYVREYTTVHQDGELSLVHLLTGWRNAILKDELSVIVVVDCVPVEFWDNLKSCLSRQGFSPHETGFRLSPLPTHTAVSKPMLIMGQWDSTAKSYNLLLEMRSKTDWGGRNVRYFGDLKALTESELNLEPTVLLLNFLPTDEILHSDVGQINSTYQEEANRVFARLAESLAEVVEKWTGPRDRVGLYVVTDHGATKILASETKSLDSKVAAKLFSDSKYRFAEVPDTEADSVPKHLWDLGYRFKQPFAEKSPTYFIPKGHNTVASGAQRTGFMHGGATPEEVIVPVGVFRLTKSAWKKPAARFVDLRLTEGAAVFYIQRLQALTIAIQNPNGQPLEVKDVRILTTGGELRRCSRPTVSAQSESSISLECIFRGESKTQPELRVEIEYQISGETLSIGLAVKASFRSAQTGGFQLRNLT
jgi:hypothetical protein